MRWPFGGCVQAIPQSAEIRPSPSRLSPRGVKGKTQIGEIDELGLGSALSGCVHAALGELQVFAVAGGNNNQIRWHREEGVSRSSNDPAFIDTGAQERTRKWVGDRTVTFGLSERVSAWRAPGRVQGRAGSEGDSGTLEVAHPPGIGGRHSAFL